MLLSLEKLLLSNKMMISPSDDREFHDFSEDHVRFYARYSSFVFKTLQKPVFQKFVYWMLKKENIDKRAVRAVYINVLPSRKKNGQSIAGKCDPSRGRIRIYPKTINFCQMFKHKFGRHTLFMYAGNRARAALIHELLHLKYTTDETTVRELSEEYFYIFTHKQSVEDSNTLGIYMMLFKTKSDIGYPLQIPSIVGGSDQGKD